MKKFTLIKILLLIVLYLIFPVCTIAQSNYFGSYTTEIEGVYGGKIYDIVVSRENTDVVYVANANGIFKTTDGAENWQDVNSNLPSFAEEFTITDLEINPSDETMIFASVVSESGSAGIYKSTDSGSSWTQVTAAFAGGFQSLAIEPINSNIIYAGDNSALYKSLDYGESWVKIRNHENNSVYLSVVTDPYNSGTIYILAAENESYRNHIYRSIDWGDNWTEITSDLPTDLNFFQLVIDPVNEGVFYVSTENEIYKTTSKGESWSLTTMSGKYFCIDPAFPDTIYSNNGDIYKSTDGGANAVKIYSGDTTYPGIISVSVNSAALYSNINVSRLIKSTDGGTSWNIKQEGLLDGIVSDIHFSLAGDKLLAATNSQLHISSNNGTDWMRKSYGETEGNVHIATVSTNSNTIFCAQTGRIIKTTDGGENWTSLLETEDIEYTDIIVNPDNNSIIYSSSRQNGFTRSTDGGNAWNQLNSGLENTDVMDLAIDPDDAAVLYAATYGSGIFKTTDGGSAWEPVNTNLTELNIKTIEQSPENSRIILAGTYEGTIGCFKSENGGTEWTASNSGLPANMQVNDIIFDDTDADIVYLATKANGLYVSIDKGETWNQALDNLSDANILSLAIKDGTLFFSAPGKGIYQSGFIFIYNVETSAITCNGYNDATIKINAKGKDTIEYSIDKGNTFSTGNTFSNLEPGEYHIVIKNENTKVYGDTITFADPEVIELGNDIELCMGETKTVDAGTAFQSYIWNTGSSNPSIEVSATGNYSVTVTDENGCISSDDISVTVYSLPGINLGNDIEICGHATVKLNAGEHEQISWNTGATVSILTVNISGDFKVEVTDIHGCSASDEISVQMYTVPTVNLGEDIEFCKGITRSIDAGDGFSVYKWNAGSVEQILTVNVSGIYKVEIEDSNGCTASDDISVTVLPVPSVDLDETKEICTGDSVLLEATEGYDSYNWSDGTIGNTLYVSDGGTYSVVVFDENGCSTTSKTIVTVHELPVISIDEEKEFCNGSSVNLNAGSSFTEYKWSTGEQTSVITVTEAGTYKIAVVDQYGCSSSDQVAVTMKDVPEKAETPEGEDALCINPGNITYTSRGAENADEYTWYLSPAGAGTLSSNETRATINWDAEYTGSSELTIKGVNECGDGELSDTLTIWISSNIPGRATIPEGKDSVCQGFVNEYTTSELPGATEYNWYLSPVDAGEKLDPSEENTISILWDDDYTGEAYLFVAGENGCDVGVTSPMLEIVVKPGLTIPPKPTGTDKLCMNSPDTEYYTYTVENAYSCEWFISPEDAGVISANDTIATVDWNSTFSGAVNIFVRAISDCGNGPFSDSLSVMVYSPPSSPEKPSGQQIVCQGSTHSYTILPDDNVSEYAWNISPGEGGYIDGTRPTATIHWSRYYSGTPSLSVQAVNACGASEASQILSITFDKLPDIPGTPAGETDLCINPDTQEYTGSELENTDTYTWKTKPNDAGVLTFDSTKATIDWYDEYTGVIELSMAGINQCGTGDYSEPLEITIGASEITGSPSGETDICQASSDLEYTVERASNATLYKWFIEPGDAGTITGSDTAAVVIWNTDYHGNASISAQAKNNCGWGNISDTLIVTVNAFPAKPTTPSGVTRLCSNSGQTKYTTSVADYAESYEWSISPEEAGTTSGSNLTGTISWNSDYSGTAVIYVAAINSCSKTLSDSLEVVVDKLPLETEQPYGDTELCINPEDNTYSSNEIENATSYSWSLSPSDAGEITGETYSITINWTDDFTGYADLTVRGENQCGLGNSQEALSILITDIPGYTETPRGESEICQGESDNYAVYSVSNATYYNWMLNPADAGTISSNERQVEIEWSNDFYGTAYLKVAAANECGESPGSDSLQITVIQGATASFTYKVVGNTVTFTNTSVNATRSYWEFGDGYTSSEDSPVHTYETISNHTVKLTVEHEQCDNSTIEEIISMTSINSHGFDSKVALYPNPAENIITLTIAETNNHDWTVEILNATGKQVLMQKNKGNEVVKIFDISHLSKGIYLVKVKNNEAFAIKKLIVN